MCVVRCSLYAARCVLCVRCCCWFDCVAWCSLCGVRCALRVACCSLFAQCCLLRSVARVVVCCVLCWLSLVVVGCCSLVVCVLVAGCAACVWWFGVRCLLYNVCDLVFVVRCVCVLIVCWLLCVVCGLFAD